jgi:hypothetical protein
MRALLRDGRDGDNPRIACLKAMMREGIRTRSEVSLQGNAADWPGISRGYSALLNILRASLARGPPFCCFQSGERGWR